MKRLIQGMSQSWALMIKNYGFRSGWLVLHLGRGVSLLNACFPICETEVMVPTVGGFKDQMR